MGIWNGKADGPLDKFFDFNKDGYIDEKDLKQVFLRSGVKLECDSAYSFIISEVSEHENKIKLKHIWHMFGYL